MIEVVFLDAGETILHPHPSFPELFSQVASDSGYSIDVEESRAVQQALAPHLVDLAEDTGVANPSLSAESSEKFWSFIYRRLLREFDIHDDDLVSRLYATFSNVASYRLFDDALPALRALAADGYRLGLISNFEEWLHEMLVELEVVDVFDCRIISGLEGVEKPDPKIFELALERAGVEPGHAVHVGDSPAMDAEPARAAGMHALLLDRFDRYPDSEVPRIGSLAELPGVVSQL